MLLISSSAVIACIHEIRPVSQTSNREDAKMVGEFLSLTLTLYTTASILYVGTCHSHDHIVCVVSPHFASATRETWSSSRAHRTIHPAPVGTRHYEGVGTPTHETKSDVSRRWEMDNGFFPSFNFYQTILRDVYRGFRESLKPPFDSDSVHAHTFGEKKP